MFQNESLQIGVVLMAWNESMQNELTVLSPLQGRLPAPGPCWGRRGGGTLDRIRKQ